MALKTVRVGAVGGLSGMVRSRLGQTTRAATVSLGHHFQGSTKSIGQCAIAPIMPAIRPMLAGTAARCLANR